MYKFKQRISFTKGHDLTFFVNYQMIIMINMFTCNTTRLTKIKRNRNYSHYSLLLVENVHQSKAWIINNKDATFFFS